VVIGIVALVVIGPRDLPKLARMAAGYIRQARGLARDFQKSFDEMGRSLEIDELRKEVEALRRGDPLKDVTKEIQALERDIRMAERGLSPPSRTPVKSIGQTAPRTSAAPTLVPPATPAAGPATPAVSASETSAEKDAGETTPGAATSAGAAPTESETPPPREERKLGGT